MNIKEQYRHLEIIKEEVNILLHHLDRERLKELTLRFAKSGILSRLFWRDNQLCMLNRFCTIWLCEQKKLSGLGIEQNIFEGIDSLEKVEDKYLSIKFGMLRIELPMPEEYCNEALQYLTENKISGIAIFYIIKNEISKKEKITVDLSKRLMQRGECVTAAILLQEAEETFPGNREILMALSDCWKLGMQWEQARECLLRIKTPTEEVLQLAKELEKVIKDENI